MYVLTVRRTLSQRTLHSPAAGLDALHTTTPLLFLHRELLFLVFCFFSVPRQKSFPGSDSDSRYFLGDKTEKCEDSSLEASQDIVEA